jgi:hypothetical protein
MSSRLTLTELVGLYGATNPQKKMCSEASSCFPATTLAIYHNGMKKRTRPGAIMTTARERPGKTGIKMVLATFHTKKSKRPSKFLKMAPF